MSRAFLGRLEKVELQVAWENGTDFTPWLTQEETLRQLSEILGMHLEYVPDEKRMAPSRADVLCRERDPAEDHWVLFDTQLTASTHDHLGQIIAHATGLENVTVVWIAAHISEAHRAALEWLNGVTDDRTHFFGVELELWRIDNSPVAPTFTVVCKPDHWDKRLELTEQQQLQLDYWSAFRDALAEKGSRLLLKSPTPRSWAGFPIGKSGFDLWTFVNCEDQRIGIVLETYGGHAKANFHLLQREAQAIHAEFGEELEWDERPGKKGTHILLRRHGTDPSERGSWTEQHAWLAEKLEQFYNVLAPRVQNLDTTEYFQDDEHTDLTAVIFPADDITLAHAAN